MNWSMLWPIALIVLSNVVYHICAKSTPAGIDPFASLTATYAVSALASAALYFALGRGGSLLREYRGLDWSCLVFGLALVGLEAGSIYMYRAGWDVSRGQLVYSICLAICLIFVGALLFREAVTPTKLAGVLVCLLGLYLINR